MMKKLIQTQLRVLYYQKFYYICLALILLMGPLLDFATSFHSESFALMTVMSEFTGTLLSELSVVSIIFVALYTCLDFNENTTKNIISRGYTRSQLLFAKYICALIGLFSFYLITLFVTVLLFGVNGIGYESWMFHSLVYSIVSIIAYTVLYVTLSFMLEKNGTAIIACLFAPTIAGTVLSLVDTYLKINISKYWFTNIGNIYTLSNTTGNLFKSVVGYVIYSILFIIIGLKVIEKREIK